MRTGLLPAVVLALGAALGFSGCASTMSGPSASLHSAGGYGASSDAATAPRSVRTASVPHTPARAKAQAPVSYDAEAQAAPAAGTVGRSPVEAARANAAATFEADRREDERIRGIMTICANCGMGDR